ncbi:hypothetical protein XELAEV_18043294mg [Xenopus laevis]|uniref:Uncharacterized protein n=1 Tax=Xenopus laevis TaxID=8355 RepID=A0A974H2N5_XENLA|nr:hypothetical protein XELAEV_18043294mg [Xenopus laevis]
MGILLSTNQNISWGRDSSTGQNYIMLRIFLLPFLYSALLFIRGYSGTLLLIRILWYQPKCPSLSSVTAGVTPVQQH